MSKRLLATVLLVGAAMVARAPTASALSVALPEQVYTFTGTCAVNDCTGDGTGVLTFRAVADGSGDYTLTSSDFVSFTYTSNLEQFVETSAAMASGALGSTAGAYDVSLSTNDLIFFSDATSGVWCANCSADGGPTHVWTPASAEVSAAPEPATWALMFAGVALTGVALRRRPRALGAG